MLATLASAAAAPPLAPPSAADAPTLDLYVGDERRTTIATNFGTATEALAAAVLRAGDPGDAVEGRVVLAARIGGEAFEFVDPPSTALRPGDALGLSRRRPTRRRSRTTTTTSSPRATCESSYPILSTTTFLYCIMVRVLHDLVEPRGRLQLFAHALDGGLHIAPDARELTDAISARPPPGLLVEASLPGAAALGGMENVVVDALADGAGFTMHGLVSVSRFSRRFVAQCLQLAWIKTGSPARAIYRVGKRTSRRWRLKHVAEDAHAVATRATSRDDGV